jgi:hypothetical protein
LGNPSNGQKYKGGPRGLIPPGWNERSQLRGALKVFEGKKGVESLHACLEELNLEHGQITVKAWRQSTISELGKSEKDVAGGNLPGLSTSNP